MNTRSFFSNTQPSVMAETEDMFVQSNGSFMMNTNNSVKHDIGSLVKEAGSLNNKDESLLKTSPSSFIRSESFSKSSETVISCCKSPVEEEGVTSAPSESLVNSSGARITHCEPLISNSSFVKDIGLQHPHSNHLMVSNPDLLMDPTHSPQTENSHSLASNAKELHGEIEAPPLLLQSGTLTSAFSKIINGNGFESSYNAGNAYLSNTLKESLQFPPQDESRRRLFSGVAALSSATGSNEILFDRCDFAASNIVDETNLPSTYEIDSLNGLMQRTESTLSCDFPSSSIDYYERTPSCSTRDDSFEHTILQPPPPSGMAGRDVYFMKVQTIGNYALERLRSIDCRIPCSSHHPRNVQNKPIDRQSSNESFISSNESDRMTSGGNGWSGYGVKPLPSKSLAQPNNTGFPYTRSKSLSTHVALNSLGSFEMRAYQDDKNKNRKYRSGRKKYVYGEMLRVNGSQGYPLRSNLPSHFMEDGMRPGNVYVGNIPPGIEMEEVVYEMKKYGPIIRVNYFAIEGRWRSATVLYQLAEDADRVVMGLHSRRLFQHAAYHKLICCRCAEDFSEVFRATSHENTATESNNDRLLMPECHSTRTPFSLLRDGPAGANLFFYGIPLNWKELELLRLVGLYGHVVGIRVPTPSANLSSLNRGFGFVSYDSKASAADALMELNGISIMGKLLKIQPKHGEEQYVRDAICSAYNKIATNNKWMNGQTTNMLLRKSSEEISNFSSSKLKTDIMDPHHLRDASPYFFAEDNDETKSSSPLAPSDRHWKFNHALSNYQRATLNNMELQGTQTAGAATLCFLQNNKEMQEALPNRDTYTAALSSSAAALRDTLRSQGSLQRIALPHATSSTFSDLHTTLPVDRLGSAYLPCETVPSRRPLSAMSRTLSSERPKEVHFRSSDDAAFPLVDVLSRVLPETSSEHLESVTTIKQVGNFLTARKDMPAVSTDTLVVGSNRHSHQADPKQFVSLPVGMATTQKKSDTISSVTPRHTDTSMQYHSMFFGKSLRNNYVILPTQN